MKTFSFFVLFYFLFICFKGHTQDCKTIVFTDKFTKVKKASFGFTRTDYSNKKQLSLSIQTLGSDQTCFLMDFWIVTYTGKQGVLGEETKPDLVNGFTFYFLFDNDESIRIDSNPHDKNTRQFSFCSPEHQNLINLLSSNKLTDIRIITYSMDNNNKDWKVPQEKQRFFVEYFKCIKE